MSHFEIIDSIVTDIIPQYTDSTETYRNIRYRGMPPGKMLCFMFINVMVNNAFSVKTENNGSYSVEVLVCIETSFTDRQMKVSSFATYTVVRNDLRK